jgi:hypothetical protein
VGWKTACGTGLVLLWLGLPSWASDDRREKLDRGDILTETRAVPGAALPEVTMRGVIDAPPQRVWDIISHCADFHRTIYRIKESRELSRDGDHVRCETVFDSPWLMPPLRAVVTAKHTVEADRWVREWWLESGDYDFNTGRWTLMTWAPGRTLVEYRVHSQPKVSVPTRLQRLGATAGPAKLFEKLREVVKD